MHPLGYFASAPDDTLDATIFSNLVWRYGESLEQLNSEQKLALRAVLSYYLFYKLKYASDYAVREAIADAMPEYTEASIRNVILTLEGISSNGAEGLIKFLTEQRNQGLQLPGRVEEPTSDNDTDQQHNHNPAIVERLTALTERLQKIGRRYQVDMATFNHELKTLLALAQGGQQ